MRIRTTYFWRRLRRNKEIDLMRGNSLAYIIHLAIIPRIYKLEGLSYRRILGCHGF